MLAVQLSRDAHKFLLKLTLIKHVLQIKEKIMQLRADPYPLDSKALQGNLKGKYRADAGEYRIIYTVNTDDRVLLIAYIGKRNDGEVYRKIARK